MSESDEKVIERIEKILNAEFEDRVWMVASDDRCATVWVSGMNVGCSSVARRMTRLLEDNGVSCGAIRTEGGIHGGVEFHVE